jgi:cytochrome P450
MELFLFHFRQTEDTVEQGFFGTTAFATIEPASLEALLSTKSKDFDLGRRRDIMYPLFGDGIFTQEGRAWKNSRDLLQAPLHHKNYKNLDVFEQNVDNLIDILFSHFGVVDLQPLSSSV